MMLTVREALGGPALMGIRHGLVLVVPAAALVILQESATPFASGWLVAATAVLQHLAAAVVLLAVPLLHRWRPVIPLPLVFVVLAAAGAVRGVVGGAFAAQLAGVDGQFGLRVLAWVLVTVIWLPPLVYADAQIRHHPALLASWYSGSASLVVETVRSRRTYAALHEALVRTVRDTVLPVIREIQRSLEANGSIGSVSARLETVQAEAITIIETEPVAIDPRAISMLEPHAVAALGRFHRSRSLFVSFLTACLLASLLAPSALLLGTAESALRSLVVVLVTCVVLAVCLLGVSRWRVESFRPVVICVVIAALAGAVAMVVVRPYPASIELGLAIGYPFVVAIAAAGLSTAIGVGLGNQRIADRVAAIADEAAALAVSSLTIETQVRQQVAALLHGPVLGRLSACVMALNFHASGPSSSDPERTAEVAAAVTAHLALAAQDLESLSFAS